MSDTQASPAPSAIPFADLVAGLSVAGLLLPEAVAYSSIAGLTPEHAIVAAVFGLATYALIGKSRFAIASPTSSSAAILAAAVASFPVAGDAEKLAIAFGLTIAAGGLFVVAGLARLGTLADFISRPVLRGFAFGLALTIVIKQLPFIAGVPAKGAPHQVLWSLFAQANAWNPTALAIGAIALALLFWLKRFPALPGAFVVLALGVLAAMAGHFCAGAVTCVGPIQVALQMPGAPSLDWETWSRLGQLAAPLALIIYAESWGSMRAYALRHNEPLDANREMIALGSSNIASGLMRGMPVGAGFSATSANEAAGSRSRLAGVVAALAIIALIALGGRYVALLPESALAAVVIAALSHALDPVPLLRLWRIDRDQYIAAAAAVAVLAFGVLNGMLIAVALSLAAVLRRFSRPHVAMLGQLGDSHDFVDAANHPDAERNPDIGVFRPSAPMFFTNCELIFSEIEARLATGAARRCVILSVEETDDFDSTALDALSEFDLRLKRQGRALLLARVKDETRLLLARAGAGALASSERSFFSVADAYSAAVKSLIPSSSGP